MFYESTVYMVWSIPLEGWVLPGQPEPRPDSPRRPSNGDAEWSKQAKRGFVQTEKRY